MPKNNFEAGLSDPESIRGKFVESITVTNGEATIIMTPETGSQIKFLTFSPKINEKDPMAPIVWEETKHTDNPPR